MPRLTVTFDLSCHAGAHLAWDAVTLSPEAQAAPPSSLMKQTKSSSTPETYAAYVFDNMPWGGRPRGRCYLCLRSAANATEPHRQTMTYTHQNTELFVAFIRSKATGHTRFCCDIYWEQSYGTQHSSGPKLQVGPVFTHRATTRLGMPYAIAGAELKSSSPSPSLAVR